MEGTREINTPSSGIPIPMDVKVELSEKEMAVLYGTGFKIAVGMGYIPGKGLGGTSQGTKLCESGKPFVRPVRGTAVPDDGVPGKNPQLVPPYPLRPFVVGVKRPHVCQYCNKCYYHLPSKLEHQAKH